MIVLAAGFALMLTVQQAQDSTPQINAAAQSRRVIPPATDTGVTATPAAAPPVIDGRNTDDVWRLAPPITAFTQWQPTEGQEPRYRTEAKVAYDKANLYVFVRAFDPHPDSIITLLERRDSFTASDMIWLFIDSYHDRRTGYEFGVNAAGVKLDQAIYDDGEEDGAWDAVWDVATQIDSLGWTAEFRIPLSQMRYGPQRDHIFGFTIDRNIYRHNERVVWPLLSQSKPGLASQLGTLDGLQGLEAPRRFEALPYVLTKNASVIRNNRFTTQSSVTLGGDLKYRVAPNITLDAAINPDFGQVESDPAVLNLTAYESFFDERRPFFVAGRGLFSFDVNCSRVGCSNEGLFYSRRIGRTPELAGVYGDTVALEPTTILGAAKLLGRFPGGMTFGVLNSTIDRVTSPGDTTYEPRTNYAVARVRQDLRGGNTTFGGIFTAVNRGLDQWTSPYLPGNAYVGALDFRHRFARNTYEVSGSFDHSRVSGSPSAILAVQTDAVHGYQRPDAGLPLDSSRTVLGGDAEELKFGKVGGEHLNFESAYQRRSAGFEINDLGFLRRADQQSWRTWAGFFDRREHLFYKRFQLNNNWSQMWTTDGLPLDAVYNTNMNVTFKNNWGLRMGNTLGQLGTTYDDRAARGGPAVRQSAYIAPWFGINGDDRRAVVPSVNLNYQRGENGRNSSWSVSPEVNYKLGTRFSSEFEVDWSRNITDNQWFGRFATVDGPMYTFAHLDQTTTSATVRLNYTFTPSISLQAYVQPFVSKGTYSDVRRLSDTPRAASYADRYAPIADASIGSDPGGFNFKQFTSNVVFRWEYLPGSTLFVVWNEGRNGFEGIEGTKSFRQEIDQLMRLHPTNTFLIKASYWLNR